MSDIYAVIRKTESAISGAVGARTRLAKLAPNESHRALMVALDRVVIELENELTKLRYSARHQKAAA